MSEKQKMIKQMLEMQRKFIEYEHTHGVSSEEFYAAPEGHLLHDYRKQYAELAMKVVSMAHEEKGSRR
ncbi:MAG: hypothetical protein KGJ12_07445 [Gammaproteobacteria bacterium]|nr:hypothetical protein [Gammaproteobacteria bacterium]